jgi:acyl-CoA thioester hydrolase
MTDLHESKDLLHRFPVVIEVDVAWADMDYFRHVNNTVFFRYFETARIAYLERIGFAEEQSIAPVGPILHSTHCRFRRPLAYPDRLRVGARATTLDADRFTMEYAVASGAQSAVAAEGGGIVVAYDYVTGTKAALPASVARALREIEGWPVAASHP